MKTSLERIGALMLTGVFIAVALVFGARTLFDFKPHPQPGAQVTTTDGSLEGRLIEVRYGDDGRYKTATVRDARTGDFREVPIETVRER